MKETVSAILLTPYIGLFQRPTELLSHHWVISPQTEVFPNRYFRSTFLKQLKGNFMGRLLSSLPIFCSTQIHFQFCKCSSLSLILCVQMLLSNCSRHCMKCSHYCITSCLPAHFFNVHIIYEFNDFEETGWRDIIEYRVFALHKANEDSILDTR